MSLPRFWKIKKENSTKSTSISRRIRSRIWRSISRSCLLITPRWRYVWMMLSCARKYAFFFKMSKRAFVLVGLIECIILYLSCCFQNVDFHSRFGRCIDRNQRSACRRSATPSSESTHQIRHSDGDALSKHTELTCWPLESRYRIGSIATYRSGCYSEGTSW